MPKPHCLCTGRTDIRCDGQHCDLAVAPSEIKGRSHGCVICWLNLHSEPHRQLWAKQGPEPPAPEIRSQKSEVKKPAPEPTPMPTVQTPKKSRLAVRKELPCIHLGAETGEVKDCEACGGKKKVPIYRCALHGDCTWKDYLIYRSNGFMRQVPWCVLCPDYKSEA